MKQEQKTVEDILRELPVVRAPEGFEARLEERLAAAEARRGKRLERPVFPEPRRGPGALLLWRVPAWAAAVPVLVTVLLVAVGVQRGPGREKGADAAGLRAVDQFAWMFYPDEAHLKAAIDLLEESARTHPDDPALQLKLIELYERQLGTADPSQAPALQTKLKEARQRAWELTGGQG
jgi:hypothetical protein